MFQSTLGLFSASDTISVERHTCLKSLPAIYSYISLNSGLLWMYPYRGHKRILMIIFAVVISFLWLVAKLKARQLTFGYYFQFHRMKITDSLH